MNPQRRWTGGLIGGAGCGDLENGGGGRGGLGRRDDGKADRRALRDGLRDHAALGVFRTAELALGTVGQLEAARSALGDAHGRAVGRQRVRVHARRRVQGQTDFVLVAEREAEAASAEVVGRYGRRILTTDDGGRDAGNGGQGEEKDAGEHDD